MFSKRGSTAAPLTTDVDYLGTLTRVQKTKALELVNAGVDIADASSKVAQEIPSSMKLIERREVEVATFEGMYLGSAVTEASSGRAVAANATDCVLKQAKKKKIRSIPGTCSRKGKCVIQAKG